MSESDISELNDHENSGMGSQNNGELSHSDKMIGVFTEPGKMFAHTSNFPPKHKDWVIPLIVLFILIGIIRSVSMLNEEVFLEAKQQQIENIEKMIEDGTLSQQDGDQAIESIDQQMEFMRGPVGWIINIISTLIFGFIFFLIIAGIYLLFIKILLKGEGTYASVLVANGLVAYITIIQVILAAILTMALGSIVMDTSVASFMGYDKSTITGWLLAKVNPISIWAYAVLSIGLAKLFKSESTGSYFALVFGLWLIGGLLIFYIANAIPFLSFLNM